MGLSVYLYIKIDTGGKEPREIELFSASITHNLNKMAIEAGIYEYLWRPEEIGIKYASDIIETVEKGLALMKADPERFEKFNASNGWGLYKHFVPWIEKYLEACKENPKALISTKGVI